MKAVIGAAAMAALALAKRQEDCTATVTTYLPFEQHRCASFHVLDYGQEAPDGACEAGACCLSIEEGHGPGIVLVDDGKWIEGDGSGYGLDGSCHGGCDAECHGECQQEGNGQREGHGHRETGAPEYIPIRTTSVPHDNITTTLTTVLTTPVTTDTVEVISSTFTTNAVITTTSDVVVTTTTTNSKGETTNAVITTETTDVITTPITTVEEITTTKQITTSDVITTTTVIVSDIPEEPTDVPMDIPEPQVPEDPTCPRPTCELGVEMALYANPFVNDFSRTYASFDPNFFKRSPPVRTRVEKNAIYISDQNTGNGFDPTLRNAAAGYRGFMFACQSGTYRFESPYSDDITILWFGDKAFNSYTRGNADIIQFYYGDNRAKTVYRDIQAGTYYPIRALWGNTGGASDLSLKIFAPDGRELSGVDTGIESYLTTRACDGSYPDYPPWGLE